MTTRKSTTGLAAATLAMMMTTAAQAAVVWDEALQGDLSSNHLAPTLLALTPGSNIVQGIMGDRGNGLDRDYFSIDVPLGLQLTALRLLPGTYVAGGASFIAVQSGPQVTTDPDTLLGANTLLGYTHYDAGSIDGNLLPTLVASVGGTLDPGRYSFWLQETGGGAGYVLDLQLAPVPLPAAAWLLFSGLGALGFGRRRRPRAA